MDFKNRNREKPIFANINLQGPCNLNCYFCIGCDFKSKIDANYLNTHFTEWENLDEYLTMLKRDGINKVYLTGQNTDPLLYEYLDDLIEYLELEGFIVGIRTNGLLANFQMENINKLNGTISFSIHSLNPDTNELITGSRIIPNLKEIDDNILVPYRISIVVNRYNIEEIEDMIMELSKLKNLRYIQLRGIATDNNYDVYKDDIVLFNKLAEYFSKKYTKTREYYTSKIYNIGNVEVSMWKTIDTTINSYNYFTDGVISDNYFIVEGYDRRESVWKKDLVL